MIIFSEWVSCECVSPGHSQLQPAYTLGSESKCLPYLSEPNKSTPENSASPDLKGIRFGAILLAPKQTPRL
jgi:hypothetical protein